MKKQNLKIILLLMVMSINSFIYAQQEAKQVVINSEAEKIVAGAEKIRTGKISQAPDYIQLKQGQEIVLNSFKSWSKINLGLSVETDFKLLNIETDQLGFSHYRYQQTFKDIPVEATMYILHAKDDKIKSMNGEIFKNLNLPDKAILTEQDALTKALFYMHADKYKWQSEMEENMLKAMMNDANATYYPKGELVYASKDFQSGNSDDLRLCYKFDIYASKPLKRYYVFVDALNGGIVNHLNRIHGADVAATAVTEYSGNRTIKTTSIGGGNYNLKETGRGNGIETYNFLTGLLFTNNSTTWDFTSTTDNGALDAHWASEKTYDYYSTKFSRNSIDNAGQKLISNMHNNTGGLDQAFWDGSSMNYGDGDFSKGHLNTATLDVTGHEITHGLTDNTAKLIGAYESGALNESFSDMFGTAIEFYARSTNANWFISEDNKDTCRYMADPHYIFKDTTNKPQPNTYHGKYWLYDSGDDGEVHNNDGVGNYWFYLLAQGSGGSKVNDYGYPYNFSGIGINNAAGIAYRTLTNYLTSNSGYFDARFYSLQSASDLFGLNSTQYIACQNAWDAVGVNANIFVLNPGSTTDDLGYGVWTDKLGNNYITGIFSGTANFGNGVQLTTNTSSDIFIAKYDKNGTAKWAYRAGNYVQLDKSFSITGDGSGHIYIGGYFYEQASFNGKNTTDTVSSAGGFGSHDIDAFIAKYDTAGNILWVKHPTGPNLQQIYGIACNASGSVFVTGVTNDAVSFGNGITIAGNGTNYIAFTAKYNSSGICQWVKQASNSGAGVLIKGKDITIAKDGNIYVCGNFGTTATFDTKTVTSHGDNDFFLAKYNSSGVIQWVKRGGGTGADFAYAVTTDTVGNVYVGGLFGSTDGTFDGNANVLTSGGAICKYNKSGTFKWAKGGLSTINDMIADSIKPNRIYLSGTSLFTSLDTLGNLISTYSILSTATISGISLSRQGKLAVCGWFSGALNIEGVSLNSAGGNDILFSTFIPNEIYTGLLGDGFISDNPSIMCKGGNIEIYYSNTGYYNAGNIFTAQLSNSSGNFSSPTVLGTLGSTSSIGLINCTVPTSLNGTKFRVRVVSSDPATTGNDNSDDLTITCPVPENLNASNLTSSSVKLNWDEVACAVGYQAQYKKSTDPSFTTVTINNLNHYKTLTGLITGTQYDYKVSTKCSTVPTWSGYSAVAHFTTPSPKNGEEISMASDISELKLFPNPATQNINVSFESDQNGITIQISDINGKNILQKQLSSEDGNYQYQFDISKLSDGIYSLLVRSTNSIRTTKFVKMEE